MRDLRYWFGEIMYDGHIIIINIIIINIIMVIIIIERHQVLVWGDHVRRSHHR